jgi:RNA polymerase sigma-70 factor (ECF subfamily)
MLDTPPPPVHVAAAFVAGGAAAGATLAPGERLQAVVLAARAAHPGIQLDAERFVRHLARHRPGDAPLDGWLESICAGDLYLACACAEGMPAAIEALDRQYRPQVRAYLWGLRPTAAFVEDVAQAVLERLLVGAEGSAPRIAEYSGRAALGSWLRVITVRLALDVRRKRTEELADERDDARAEGGDAQGDPELDLFKRRYAGELNAALRAAVGALASEQRSLLRTHYVEGATLDQLVVTLGVSRATVVRRLAAARQEILAGARRQLGGKLRLGPAELDSLMGVMHSQLHLSLSSALPG